MPSAKRKTEEETLVEVVTEGEVARAAQLAEAWELSQAPRDLWPDLEARIADVRTSVTSAETAWEAHTGFPSVDLELHRPEPTALIVVSSELARRWRVLPMRKDGDRLFVAMENPQTLAAIDAFRRHTGLSILPISASPSQLEIALEEFYPETAPSGDRGAVPPRVLTAFGAGEFDDSDPDDYPNFAAFLADRGGSGSVAPLTPRQEKWLARCIERGGKQGERAREILVNSNLRLVIAIAKKYENRGLDMAALIQEGTLGLIHALSHFDYRRGFRFSTYATHWIRQSLGRAVEGDGRSVRLPEHAIESLEKIKRLREQLQAELGRLPTPDELAAATDLHRRDSETLWGNLLPSEESPSSRVFRHTLREEINRALERLSEREREVLSLRYGLGEETDQTMTLEQVGEAVQLSRDDVRRIEAGALQKLRQSQMPPPPTPDPQAEILAELRAIRGEISALREENRALRREVAALRKPERPASYATTLMPYVRADDRALPL